MCDTQRYCTGDCIPRHTHACPVDDCPDRTDCDDGHLVYTDAPIYLLCEAHTGWTPCEDCGRWTDDGESDGHSTYCAACRRAHAADEARTFRPGYGIPEPGPFGTYTGD